MKQTENNEMDLLLRSLARRERAGSVAPEGRSTMHLDADELNAFAEQVLPPAARARYTLHLADCARCRKTVAQLTSSSGANVTKQADSQESAAGFRQKFSALFSPKFLRYAVPSLALLAFVAVALVALRQQPQPDFVAQNQPTVLRDASLPSTPAASPSEAADSAAAVEERQTAESPTRGGKAGNNQPKTGERNEASNTATTTDTVTVTSDTNSSLGKAAGAVAQPSYAPEPLPAPPAAKPQTTVTESRTEVAARQKEATAKSEPAREQEGSRSRTDRSQNEVTRTTTGGVVMDGRNEEKRRKLEAQRDSDAGAKAKDDEADSRTVSGRRFRRQRGVWIDTAYQSSMATTNVARGSEQFRALAADEPGIRGIAAELPGEVIVVWKGRAYRIR